jgi:hypothetical protein
MAKQESKIPSTTEEFGKFTQLLDRLLKVPHSKIKAELDAEKRIRSVLVQGLRAAQSEELIAILVDQLPVAA